MHYIQEFDSVNFIPCLYFLNLNCKILAQKSMNIAGLLPDSSDMITAFRSDRTAYAMVSEKPKR